jgi:hypothetical protein
MMRKIVAVALVVAAAALLRAQSATSATAPPAIHPGDILTYDLSLESQMHPQSAPGSSTSNGSSESTVQGSATLRGMNASAFGVARARCDLSLQLTAPAGTQSLARTLTIEFDPSGAARSLGGDASLLVYIDPIEEAAAAYGGQTLHVGDQFQQSFDAFGLPQHVEAAARVVGKSRYRGYPAFSIQVTAGGSYRHVVQGSDVTETYTLAGTVYYDSADRLLIGQSTRVNDEMRVAGAGAQGRFVTISTQNVLLHSFKRAAAARPIPPPQPAQSPTPEPSPSASPTPFQPDQYYTPTPPAPTPSPVVVPYPPSRGR